MGVDLTGKFPPDPWGDIPDPLDARPAALAPHPGTPEPPKQRSPTRREARARRWLLLAGSLGWLLLAHAYFGVRAGLNTPSAGAFTAAQCALWLGLAALTFALAVRAGRRGLGGPPGPLVVGTAFLPAAFIVAAMFWLPPDGSPQASGLGPPVKLVSCFAIVLLIASPAIFATAYAFRRAFPAAPATRGAALGSAIGLLGALVLGLHCNVTLPAHAALAHGLPIALAAVLGGALGYKLTRA